MRTIAVIILLLVAGTSPAADEPSCGVRYLSADHVYLDCGRAAGLEAGLTVRVMRDGVQVAELLVEYAADHSASCSIVQKTGDIVVGDRVFYEATATTTDLEAAAADTLASRQRELKAPSPNRARAATPGPRLTGSAALRWEHGVESGGTDVTSDVLTLPFRLRARDLGHGWEFRAKGSLRRIRRDGGNDVRPTEDWRNRIGEVALVRDGRREDWHLAVGRIGVRAAAAAGPFDGAAVSRRITGPVRLGAFGGWAPAWQDMDFSTEDQLAGVSLQVEPTGADGLGLVLAGIGRYHKGEVSREYVAMTTTWRGGPGLSLLQAAEVDINRGWKRDAGAKSVDLSSLALTGRWQANPRLAFVAGYDDRKPVRTWETRDTPDSLFQDAGRRGLRGGVEVRAGAGARLNLDASVRTPENGEADAKSWGARLWLPSFPVRDLDFDVSVRGFTGPVIGGLAPGLGLAWRGSPGWYLRAAGGLYRYIDEVGDDDRNSTWASASIDHDLGRHWSAAVEGRGDWGDSGDVLTAAAEIRCRF
ncbi:MAG TPA: hypothetical protein PLQ13_04640 [Candidatus Krumholzibacteria bacterium]|nr:hypothetical protein [Candidatus Krumholzibacteria bacterium]